MPKLKKRLTILALGACVGALMVPAVAQGAVNFGSDLENDPSIGGVCELEFLGPCTIASIGHPVDGGISFAGAPIDGVITRFRTRARVPDTSQVTFRLVDINRPDPNNENVARAALVGTGLTVTLPGTGPIEVPIREFVARVPVKKGQKLAIEGPVELGAIYASNGSAISYIFTPPLVPGAPPQTSTEVAEELVVAATVEPDADNDGFGDETQDQCPSQAATQSACDTAAPGIRGLSVTNGKINYNLAEAATVSFLLEKKLPGRKVGKKCVAQTPKNKAKQRCARFKAVGKAFGGPGSPGQNQVALPKKPGPGAYRLTMTATDAAGNVATSTTNFTVAKKGKKARK